MIDWTKPNFLKSKKQGFIAVSRPQGKDEKTAYFEGIIINCEDDITKGMLHHSPKFAKDHFELIEEKNVIIKFKSNEEIKED